ncbi:MAG TPA: hypothetical protein VFE58_02985 [Tepidisphaeraceae bacterium]|jgi:hypothetical protein|nr:hypothetical protein [Tepidisphaeraceae bacterium]
MTSWDTFERYRQRGVDARRAGQWDSARVYLLEAARAMYGVEINGGIRIEQDYLVTEGGVESLVDFPLGLV